MHEEDNEQVERILHIEEMKAELKEMSGDQVVFGEGEMEVPLSVEEEFYEHILAFERAETGTHRGVLEGEGVVLSAPEELDDEALTEKLWEVIQAWARHRTYLLFTDHLSDRELYTELWTEIFDHVIPLLPPEAETNCRIDFIASGDEEDTKVWLTYYADEEYREQWRKDFPDEEVPPHQDPPYDRDRHLPTPPVPPSPFDDPEVTDAWIAECHGKLLHELAEEGLTHGPVHEDPLSYAPGFACVWSIEDADQPDTVGWWAINGDLPTTCLTAAGLPDPRAFLRAVSARWKAMIEVAESSEPPEESTSSSRTEQRKFHMMLLRRAEMLEQWAADDEAWGV